MPCITPIDICTAQLNWHLTTEQVFANFAHLPWAILLDSANAQHINAKYDIICINPIACLVSNIKANPSNINNKLIDCTTENEEIISGDPFDVLKRILQKYYPQNNSTSPHPLPFSGGAVGAFAYDLGRSIEKLPELTKKDIQLPEMNIGFYDWAVIYDHQKKSWFITHCRGEKALLKQLDWLETNLFHENKIIAEPNAKSNFNPKPIFKSDFNLVSNWQHQLSKKEYEHKFAQIQRYLQSGDCYQVNLTQRFSAKYQGDEWQAYVKLREANQAPFSAFIRLPKQVILSISPERFLSLTDGKIETKPIKGTLPRQNNPELDKQAAEQLQNSTKDRAENLMIVDLLRNDIGKVAETGSVKVPHLFAIESFPAVHHLVSTISAKLKSSLYATDLLKHAFPGGSITGAPKIRAMEIIEELEPSRRSIYCGAIGYISCNGNMDTSITIRTLIAENETLYCWAGGGIVADSNCDAEYQETFDKISRIIPVLKEE